MNFLRFEDGPAAGTTVEWTGDWPPEDEVGFALGTRSGQVTFVQMPLHEDLVETIKESGTIWLLVYGRGDTSELSDEVASHPNLARGAVYRLKEELVRPLAAVN